MVVIPSAHATAPVVLTVDRLEFWKATEVLVEAAARLRGEIEGLEVVFVGNVGRPNEYRDRLVGPAQRMGLRVDSKVKIADAELRSRYASARCGDPKPIREFLLGWGGDGRRTSDRLHFGGRAG